MIQSSRVISSRAGLSCTWAALSLVPVQLAHAVSYGGDVAVTTNYINRGYSETYDRAALQLDLHVSTQAGTFVGVWASTLNHRYQPYANFDLQEYIGQRFDLSSAWNTSITATNYSYVGSAQYYSSDYQQLSVAVSYLDRWTFTLSAAPNMLRYWERGDIRTGRFPAYDAETSGQWLLGKGLFVTGGAGYFLFTGSDLPIIYDSTPIKRPTLGYAYGNVGLAYEWRSWRIDVGYFLTQRAQAEKLFPYPIANNRVAGTLSWRF